MDKANLKYAVFLAWFTVGYNVAEGAISTYYGMEEETLSLFGFGIDSFIEMISGLGIVLMVYRISKNKHSHSSEAEKLALKITGYCLYALTILLLITALYSFYVEHSPKNTISGVIIASLSIGVMYWMIQEKIKVGKALNSAAIIADANCAKVCMYMSLVLLLSNLIFYFTHWIYLDGIGAIGIAYFAYTEGKEAIDESKGIKCHHC